MFKHSFFILLSIFLLSLPLFSADVAPEFPGKIIGDTDETKIGNVGDRLKVTPGTATSPSGLSAYSKKLRYVDMNASSGGVARDTTFSTTWIDTFSYSGSGLVVGFTLTLEALVDCSIRLIIDGEEIFGSNGIAAGDLIDASLYNMADGKSQPDHGLIRNGLSFRMQLDFPIEYKISVVVKVKRSTGTKKFHAGLMVLTKET